MTSTLSLFLLRYRQVLCTGLLLLTALVVLLLFFAPATQGVFVLDDFGVLPGLFDNYQLKGFWFAVLEGAAGPLGRPVSLFTFALQAQAWPSEPALFKWVNIAIHLLNSLLVLLIFRQLLTRLSVSVSVHWVSVIAALLWCVAPINVSSVAYVIQRMTLLSALFSFIAVYSYLRYLCLPDDRGYRRLLWLIAVHSGALLGVLAKENGLVVYLHLLLLWLCFERWRTALSPWVGLAYGLPVAVFVLYVFAHQDAMVFDPYFFRDFTLGERLLSQVDVIVDYLQAIAVPDPKVFGVFHDDYPVTRAPSLLWGLKALGLLAGCVWAGYSLMRSGSAGQRLAAMAILWYALGQVIESTVFPLELYFEHRNYYPAILLYASGVLLLAGMMSQISVGLCRLLVLGLCAYVGLYAWTAHQQIRQWGSDVEMSFMQTQYHPDSQRARAMKVGVLHRYQQADWAQRETQQLFERTPNDSVLLLSKLTHYCDVPEAQVPLQHKQTIVQQLAHSQFEYGFIKILTDTLHDIAQQQCTALTYADIHAIIAAVLPNEQFQRKSGFLYQIGYLAYVYQNDWFGAAHWLGSIEQPLLWQIIELARAQAMLGQLAQAQITLQQAWGKLPRNLSIINRVREIRQLQQAIQQTLAEQEAL